MCFWNPEEVTKWCVGKTPGGKLEQFYVGKIREYYTNIVDQEELGEALGWFTEHLFDDYRVTLKFQLPSGQTLTAINFDLKETRWCNYDS